MSLEERHKQAHVDQWIEEGFTLIPNFFTQAEIEPIIADFEELYQIGVKGKG